MSPLWTWTLCSRLWPGQRVTECGIMFFFCSFVRLLPKSRVREPRRKLAFFYSTEASFVTKSTLSNTGASHARSNGHARQQDAQVNGLWDLVFIKKFNSWAKALTHPLCACVSVRPCYGRESQTKERFDPQSVHPLHPFIKALVLIFPFLSLSHSVCVCLW